MYQQTNPIYQNSKAVRDMVLLLMPLIDICDFLGCEKYPTRGCTLAQLIIHHPKPMKNV